MMRLLAVRYSGQCLLHLQARHCTHYRRSCLSRLLLPLPLLLLLQLLPHHCKSQLHLLPLDACSCAGGSSTCWHKMTVALQLKRLR